MFCPGESREDKYNFFKNVDEYIDFDSLTEENSVNNIYNIDYTFIEKNFPDHISALTRICTKLAFLTGSLIGKNGRTNSDNYDFNFVNYWLNREINEIHSSNLCKKFFYQYLMIKNREKANLKKFSGQIYDIEESEFEDMNKLYNMYKYYNKIHKIISSSDSKKDDVIQQARNCVNIYKTFKEKCRENTTYFCDTLKDFKEKYENINLCNYNIADWGKKSLPSLEDQDALLQVCETTTNRLDDPSGQRSNQIPENAKEDSDGDTKSITIGTVATLGISFIFLILYKFTSIEQFLRYRMNKNESVWQNIDEEMNEFTHISEHEHIKAGNTSYNIAYDSV
ncbi:PIR Superfamily Protein [Plasmodium ovale wallikeri]|uniref:PIR Superfamily Protein n=1 Tax=Plasmodium ovale wallikeri TaxID=864142 RepID=A0A1A9AKU1_PLAOA|nr:PIR Superfamily Protein [Plasmodium ovale wallikeri]